MGLYPTEEEITMFGEKLKFPGLKDGKFTNGSFTDPKQLASFIPAETLNLVLDNLEEFIRAVGLEPNNTNINQLAEALNIRTKYSVQKITLSKLIKFYTEPVNTITEKLPDEKGIIHSEDIDLRQKVAEQIGRNKEDIRILNWNLSAVYSAKGLPGYNSTSFFTYSSDIEASYSSTQFSVFTLCVFNTPAIARELDFYLLVQIADNLTDDIINFNPSDYSTAMLPQTIPSLIHKATTFYINHDLVANSRYSINLFCDTFASACLEKGNTGSQDSVASYFTASKQFKASSTNSFFVQANYNYPSKIFYGDEIKVRVRLVNLDKIYAMLDRVFDVDVRYVVINK